MRFEWDEKKRISNLRKHGIDFAECERVFAGDIKTIEDGRFDYGEYRYVTVGLLDEQVVVIAHTEDDEVIRFISARKASKSETALFFQ